MHPELKIALLQIHLHWENPVANRANIESKLKDISSDTDIVVLPEMFTSGFSMNPSLLAETMDGETVRWLVKNAQKYNVAICGSMIISEHDAFYNRLLFVTPDGIIAKYDKRHTFNMAGEGEVYKAGTERKVVDYLGWKIALQICYDLRFPVFARNVEAYDVVLYVANWPKPRIHAWDALLKARAIENMAYSVGVNRVGLDGNNLEYTGHSAVYNLLGDTITFAKAEENTIYATLSKNHISQTREKLPFLEDMDQFKLIH